MNGSNAERKGCQGLGDASSSIFVESMPHQGMEEVVVVVVVVKDRPIWVGTRALRTFATSSASDPVMAG